MSIIYEERPSDSPYIETVTRGVTIQDGSPTRPAECSWHLVISRQNGRVFPLLVGPWDASGEVVYKAGAELLWVRFKLGAYMPSLPTRNFLNSETLLPEGASHSFWLNGEVWQHPDFENVETFAGRLVRKGVLAFDPVVHTVLAGRSVELSDRTLRHRFLHSTGLTQSHIRQFKRARQAAALLARGVPILEVVYQLGYFDQPHLTRSVKRFLGQTPSQLAPACLPELQPA